MLTNKIITNNFISVKYFYLTLIFLIFMLKNLMITYINYYLFIYD
nr:MAG TPA: hypothetical protein [Caudoviricetes sp.]